jgi:hypothetical protein
MIVSGQTYSLPAEGLHRAVAVDILDCGVKETQWGPKKSIAIVWEIDQLRDDGTPFLLRRYYTPSLHEKSTLHKDLRAWRGKPFTPEELRRFDLEAIISKSCSVLVEHNVKGDRTYANVVGVLPCQGQPLQPSGHYVREQDREGESRLQSPALPF